jgi:hypothetical protein
VGGPELGEPEGARPDRRADQGASDAAQSVQGRPRDPRQVPWATCAS